MKYWIRRVLYFVRRLHSGNASTRLRAANQILVEAEDARGCQVIADEVCTRECCDPVPAPEVGLCVQCNENDRDVAMSPIRLDDNVIRIAWLHPWCS
jgi:hypothetical protein